MLKCSRLSIEESVKSVHVPLYLRIFKLGKLYGKEELKYMGKGNVADVFLLECDEKKLDLFYVNFQQ